MTSTYIIKGMTCTGCQAKVQKLLSAIPRVSNVSINLPLNEATIDMSDPIPIAQFESALRDYPKYTIHKKEQSHEINTLVEEEQKSWLATYKPILMVFFYILVVTLLTQTIHPYFNWQNWMQNFMAAFFLVFSFFKLLDLKAFAESYSGYDIIAKRWAYWGYIYAFVEVALGIAYLLKFMPLLTNIITFVVMSVSIIGVLQSVLQKRKIKCACLGAVFNLPMSTLTIIEDGVMIVMCCLMIVSLLRV